MKSELDADFCSFCCQALSFLPPYSYLVCYESGFMMAHEARLIAKDVDYNSFRQFIAPFQALLDSEMSPRYEYGQLRPTQLNWAVQLLQPRATEHRFPWYYQQRLCQTSQFLEKFSGPFLFIFALRPPSRTPAGIFSVVVIIVIVVLVVLLISGIAGLLIGQASFAIRKKRAEAISTRAKQAGAATGP